MVMSGISASTPEDQRTMRSERRSPPSALGRGTPSTHARERQRLTLAALTPKRAATARWLKPSATASRTRTRRSRENAFDMSVGLLPGRQCESQTRSIGNPARFSQIGLRTSQSELVARATVSFAGDAYEAELASIAADVEQSCLLVESDICNDFHLRPFLKEYGPIEERRGSSGGRSGRGA